MATHAFGVKLEYVGTPKNVPIGKLTNLGGIDLSADTIETTHHDGTNKFKQFIQGLRDGGELPIEFIFDAADNGQLALIDHYNQDADGGVDSMIATFPEGSTWKFDAIVTALKVPGDAPVDDKLMGTATLKITDCPVFTEAGGS